MRINLFEWESQKMTVESNALTGLQSYLEKVWENRPLIYDTGNDEENNEPGESFQRFLDFKPGAVKARNYVGFVQYGDLRINIEPKVFEGRADIDESDKISLLLKWLSYTRRFHFPHLESSFNHKARQQDWLEAFIFLFANYTEEILNSSPHQSYQEFTEETTFVKGRLAIMEYVRENLSKGRRHKVYSTHEPFVYDNLFNRVVKHTSKFLSGITLEKENQIRLQQIVFLLDEVQDIYCTAADCDKIPISRMFPEKERIAGLCKMFLANQSYNTNSVESNNLCVLLPMEVIFEEFVFGFMEKHFSWLNPRRQARDMYLAQTGDIPPVNVFLMKHDILIPGKLIIDTKYKFRDTVVKKKKGVEQSDLYQMVAYAFRRGMREVLMIYPKITNANNENAVFLIAPIDNILRGVTISVSSLDIVADIEGFSEMVKRQLVALLKNSKIMV